MPKCNNVNCKINKGICDKQHKCFTCHEYLHAFCGRFYYDDEGYAVDSVEYPVNCFKCHELLNNETDSNNEKANSKPRRQKKDKSGISGNAKPTAGTSTNQKPTKSPSESKSNENEIQTSSGGRPKRLTRSSFNSDQKKSPENKKESKEDDDAEVSRQF